MTRKASIKETGEEISRDKWQRFESAVGVGRDREGTVDVQTDQPFQEEVESPGETGGSKSSENDARGHSDLKRETGTPRRKN